MSLRIHGHNTVLMDVLDLNQCFLNYSNHPRMPEERLRPYGYQANIVLPDGRSGPGLKNPAPLWYVEGANKKILVETGLSKENVDECNRAFKARNVAQFYVQNEEHDIDRFLGRLGVKPEDIDIVILTHLHLDHFINGSHYPNAEFIVQKDEISWALSPPTWASFYYEEFSKHLERIRDRIMFIEGNKKIVEGVEVWKIGGHTPGLQVVAVETSKGLAVIAGDQFLTYKHIELEWPMGYFYRLDQVLEGINFIKSRADIIIPQHDLEFWERHPEGIVG